MFGLFFFVLFTPGVSEFLCTSSDLDISYTFCDSTAHAFMFNLTPCSLMNESIWKAALTWIPRSDITFLEVVFNVWYNGDKALHWKEILCSGADDEYSVCGMLKGDDIVNPFNMTWKGYISLDCTDVLGGSRGTTIIQNTVYLETIAAEFNIKGVRIKFPKGNYNVILQGFSGDSENNTIVCLNFTMIVKQDAF